MSDKVNLIIEIPKEVFEARKIGEISPWVTVPILDAVQNGIPLDTIKGEMKDLAEQYKEYRYANTYISLCIKIIDKHIDKADMKNKNNC